MFVPLKTHNVLDYVVGAALIVTPYIFGFAEILAARNAFLALGFAMIAYSSLTDYYYSVAKIIPLGLHMGLDVAVGLITMFAPWIFSYNLALTGGQMAVHWILGLGAIGLVSLTKPRTEAEKIRMGEDVKIASSRRAA